MLASLNNQITIITHAEKLTQDNSAALLNNADIVLDCSDNFTTRYSVNRFCVQHKTPLISGAALATKGQLISLDLRNANSPCYGCIFPQSDIAPLINCDNAGVISPLLGIIGSMQAQLTLNMLLGHSSDCVFMSINALTLQQQQFKVVKDIDCKECR